MSAETHRLFPTLSPSFLVSSSISMRRPASTTVKPAFISASDAARPTPVPAPVTTAILFAASAIGFLALLFLGFCFGLVGWSRDVLMRRAQRRRPARTQIVEIGFARLDAVIEHGLAVFVLADLQIRRVGGALDEIAGGVDHEQPHPRALDLAAEQE